MKSSLIPPKSQTQFQAAEDNPEKIPTFTVTPSPPKVSLHNHNPQTQFLSASFSLSGQFLHSKSPRSPP